MHIENVQIENFGPIARLQCVLEKEKINFIIGKNGSGKTSFMAAIYAQLKTDNYITYDRNSKRISNVNLILQLKKQKIEIHQKYLANNHEMEIKKITNFEEQIKELREVQIIIIKNLDFIDINEINCEKIINFLENYKNKISNQRLYKTIFERLTKSEKNMLISGGEQKILKIMHVLAEIEGEAIVLFDNIIESDGVDITKFILEVMHQINYIQFIIMKLNTTKNVVPDSWVNNIMLEKPIEERNPVGVYEPDWGRYKIISKKKKENYKYYIGEVLKEEETKNLEYKEIRGNNACSAIVQNAVVYAVAFLNAKRLKTGCIKWGITDNRKVVGVVLNKNEKDTIRKRICEEFQEIKPYFATEQYQIKFEKVFSKDGKELENTYIVELIIQGDKNNYLYATPKGEVYVKTEGGKRKLTILEIQEEFAKRNFRELL